MQSSFWKDHLVLAGGGHTHALVLRRWLMRPRSRPQGCRISLVSRTSRLCYSGLVPAVLAGLRSADDCRLDLRRLCTLADVAFLEAEITGLDPLARRLHLAGRPSLTFDRLSLDVGSVTPAEPGEMAVRPLEPLLAWGAGGVPPEPRLRGGGVTAVEVALALRSRGLRPRLLLRGGDLQLGSAAANRLARKLLAEAAIPLQPQAPMDQGADLACTGSQAPAWLAAAGLPVAATSGRVLTAETLQVLGHPHLFAAGDCGLVAAHPRPPSGVWAVRAAPLLATNLQRSLAGLPLVPWRPPPWSLQLVGDGGLGGGRPRAFALWGPLAFGPSRWLWRWKQHLDQRFLAMFAALPPMAPSGAGAPPAAMACRGCAAKLPGSTLRSALAQLAAGAGVPHSPAPEDAPLLRELPGGERLLQSVDGFPALVADAWLNGRLTTLHACSDLWASGAKVESVQVIVTLPQASPPVQEDLLLQTLAGVRSVLEPLGARLLGGHTLEGRDGAGLGLALTVNGLASPRGPGAAASWPKGPLRPGDALLLSRPIGSGVLFAAAMAGAVPAVWIDRALALMQQSQAPLVELLGAHGCHACTDVTGFGLLGHLGEMLAACPPPSLQAADPSPLVVDLDAAAIPAFCGAHTLLAQGHASSLAPANGEALTLLEREVRLLGAADAPPTLAALLIDPQTCGPLLAALPGERAERAVQALHGAGFPQAAVIGRVR